MSAGKTPKKKGNLLGGLASAVKNELFEGGGPSAPDTTSPPAPGQQTQVAPMLSAFAPSQPSAASAPSPAAAAMMQPAPAPEQPDAEAVALLQKEVLVEVVDGKPSRFMLFLRMWEALGRPIDPTGAFAALKVTAPDLTIEAIREDATVHLELLDKAHAKAEAEFAKFASDSFGAKDSEIEALSQANAHATAEIERHQREIGERTAAIVALQQARANDEAAIQRARQRTITAEGAVRAQLQQAQSLLAR